MKFAIFATGGVGGYFGGKLAQSGQDVSFIARGAHKAAIAESGLQVDSIGGDFSVNPASVFESPRSIGVVDVVLLAIKSWQLDDAIEQMKPLIGSRTMIVPLMNGVDHMDALLSAFGKEHVLGGFCRISSFVTAPGRISHVAVQQPHIAFGELDAQQSERVNALKDVFLQINGMTVDTPKDVLFGMWEKFMLICAYSGVGAVTRQPVGGYRMVKETRVMFRRVLEEVVAIANARGVKVDEASINDVMNRLDSSAPDMMASMQKDIIEGRPSELEAQTGAVVRMGRALNISTPVNDLIYAALLPMELKARGK
jgi:2-dehydropantoate 2-reductase